MSTPTQANRQIARAAGTVMIAIVLGQLVGLLAKVLTANQFGVGMESDAFFAANRFSDILFNLVAGGALGSAFIPTFTGLLTREQRPAAWKLASAIANLVLLVLTVLSILAIIFAPQIVRYILAPGFAATNPEKEALTVALLRIQLPSAVIFGLSGLLMGILNAHQSFFLPALAPAMYQAGWVFGVLVLRRWLGIYGLAWGVVAGAALHLLIQLPALLRLSQRRYFPTLGLKIAEVREVARLMAPRLLGVAVVQVNFLLNAYLASLQPEGSYTGISLAFPLMYMPLAAIAQSVATATLPAFSAQVALGQIDEMRTSLAGSLRAMLLLVIPASLGLMLLRTPLVALLYQRGEFTAASTQLVAWALLWYAGGLVFHSLLEVVSRAFYALHDTRTPVTIGILAMGLNLVLSIALSSLFTSIGWMPHGGLALANSLATALEITILLFLLRRRLAGLHATHIWDGVGRAALAGVVMVLVLVGWMYWTSSKPSWVVASGGVLLGVLAYVLVLAALGVPELGQLIAALRRRFVNVTLPFHNVRR
jgi:putative peptidoglycan lipid II flippase